MVIDAPAMAASVRCPWLVNGDSVQRVVYHCSCEEPRVEATNITVPISNLSVLSVIRRSHIPPFQSAFQQDHLTETGFLRVLSDLQVVDRCALAALVTVGSLHSTVDHSILLQRLQLTFSIDDTVHRWFQSYLSSPSGSSTYVAALARPQLPVWYARRATGINLRANLIRAVHHGSAVNDRKSWIVTTCVYADDTPRVCCSIGRLHVKRT